MSNVLTALTTIKTDRPDVRRRGQILVSLTLGILTLLICAALPLLLRGPRIGQLVNLALGIATFAAAYALGRQGMVSAGAYLLVVISIIGSVSGTLIEPANQLNNFFLVITVILASVLLGPGQIWVVLLVCLGSLLAVGTTIPPATRESMGWMTISTTIAFLLVATAAIAFTGARSAARAVLAANEARLLSEEAGRQLEVANAALEARVEQRTTALRQIADEQRAVAAELKTSLEAQRELNRIVADLAVPVIPVRAGTLVVPLVGNIDSARAEQILSLILGRIEQTAARTIVLDVTGVALVDTHVAAALLRVAQAALLMGAETILAGIRPEVAQTLIGLGVDLGALHTVATLQEALQQ